MAHRVERSIFFWQNGVAGNHTNSMKHHSKAWRYSTEDRAEKTHLTQHSTAQHATEDGVLFQCSLASRTACAQWSDFSAAKQLILVVEPGLWLAVLPFKA